MELSAEVVATIGDWVDGWSKSRHSGTPLAHDWGFSIEVGTPDEVGRFVLTDASDDSVIRMSRSVTQHNFWIKVPRPVAEVAPLLGPRWQLQDAQQLMTSPVSTAPPPSLPSGYLLSVERDSDDSVQVAVAAADGSIAARGRMGFGSRAAVADRVATMVDHQRRGLGRAVMSALCRTASDAGYERAVLLASVEGRALYTSLGWRDVTPFSEARFIAS